MPKEARRSFLTYRFALKKVYKGARAHAYYPIFCVEKVYKREIVPRPLRIVLRGRRLAKGKRTHRTRRILFGAILTYRFALKKVYKGARAHAYYPIVLR